MTVNVLNGIVRIVSGRHIGTGFVVTADGLILTCAHVLGSSMPEKARVVFQGGEEREGRGLAKHETSRGAQQIPRTGLWSYRASDVCKNKRRSAATGRPAFR